MKKKYWVTEQGILMSSTGVIGVSNGTKISQSKYYQLLKEQKRMSIELDENGFTIDKEGNLFFRGVR